MTQLNQHFCVIGSVGKFKGVGSNNCLPALELSEETTKVEEYIDEPVWSRKQWQYVQQLHGMLLFLQKKLNEHTDKEKNKANYIYE